MSDTLTETLNVRIDATLQAEVDAVSTLMSRDGLTLRRSAIARAALVRGLRAMRDELARCHTVDGGE